MLIYSIIIILLDRLKMYILCFANKTPYGNTQYYERENLMKTEEIYYALCQCRNSEVDGGKALIQLKQEGVKISDIDDDGIDVISHVKYEGEDGGIVEEVITFYDHSRTFELRPDPNHFYITQYDKTGKKIREAHYVQMDKI